MNAETEITITQINEFYEEALHLREKAQQLDHVVDWCRLRKATHTPEYQHSQILASLYRSAAESLVEIAHQADRAFFRAWQDENCSCNPRNDPCAACTQAAQIKLEHQHLEEDISDESKF